MITLDDGTDTITLHKDLLWSDEANWNPVQQTANRTITGANVIQIGTMLSGRPITLEPEDDRSAPTTREVVDQLRNWAAVPGKEMTLTIGGVEYLVIFRHQDGGFEAKKWIHYDDVEPTDIYLVVIRLMEIE
jgi:hypothetical protein